MNQVSKHNELFEQFSLCLKEERFFDAHEVIETLWFPRRFEQNDEIKFLKGLINAAVSFELRKRGRIEASRKVWNTYTKYRPLLHAIESPYKNNYFKVIQELDALYLVYN